MSSQLVDTERRRLRVTRVAVLNNRSKSRQPARRAPPLTSRRQLRVDCPHFHNEIFPDSPAPNWKSKKSTSSLSHFLRHHVHDPDARVTTGRRRLRITRVTVVDPRLADAIHPTRRISQHVSTTHRNPLARLLVFTTRLMKPLKMKMLVGILALLVFSASWLCGPDPTRSKSDPASRWNSIEDGYIKGKNLYWVNPAEFLWIWFKVEAGWTDDGLSWDWEYVE